AAATGEGGGGRRDKGNQTRPAAAGQDRRVEQARRDHELVLAGFVEDDEGTPPAGGKAPAQVRLGERANAGRDQGGGQSTFAVGGSAAAGEDQNPSQWSRQGKLADDAQGEARSQALGQGSGPVDTQTDRY